jgi:hypothetical protein
VAGTIVPIPATNLNIDLEYWSGTHAAGSFPTSVQAKLPTTATSATVVPIKVLEQFCIILGVNKGVDYLCSK